MDIKITQTYSQIGIQTTNAKLELRNNGQTDYTISHTEPKIEINSTLPKIQIDQSACFADEGLKGIKDFMDEVVQLGHQTALEYVTKKAEEGDSYTNFKNRNSAILSSMRQDLYKTIDYNVAAVPSQRPDISLERGEVNTNVVEGEINTTYNNIPIEGTYTPGSVSFYLLQEGSISIEYVGKNLDVKV